MSTANKIVQGAKVTLAGKATHTIANAVLILALTNVLLAPAQYGLLFLTLSIVGGMSSLLDLGLSTSAARYIADLKDSNPSQIPLIIRLTLALRVGIMVIVGGMFALSSDRISELMDEPTLTPLLLIGIGYLLFQSIGGFLRNIFQGFNRVGWSAVLLGIDSISRVVVVFVFVGLLGLGAAGALVGYVIGAALSGIIGLIVAYLFFYSTYDAAESFETGLVERIGRYCVPLAAWEGAAALDKRLDTVLVGVLIGPVAVGFYTLGKQISEFITVPASSLGFAASPTYAEEKASGETERAARMYQATVRYTLLLYVPAATGLVLIAEPAVRFTFGTAYLGAVPVIKLFAVYSILQSITQITSQAIEFLGLARQRAYSKFATMVANAGLTVVLIPIMGVIGAVVASVVSFGIYAISLLWIIHTEFKIDTKRLARNGVLIAAITVGMGGVVWVAAPWISGPVSLIGVIALGLTVWAVGSLGCGIVDLRQARALLG